MLRKIRTVRLESRMKLFRELKSFIISDTKLLPEFLYSKAEAAFRINNIPVAKAYIKQYQKMFRYKKPQATYKKILRLSLILESKS